MKTFHSAQVHITTMLLLAVFLTGNLFAHCDSVEGPVVKAAKKSIETGNLNYVLIWVRTEDEKEITQLFERINKVRTLEKEAALLAEDYFFETVVRVHRMGEGVGYTGLKSADLEPEEGIAAADLALENKSIEIILHHTGNAHHGKVQKLYNDVQAKSSFDVNDLKTGREYVAAYVTFIHYIEGLFRGDVHNDAGQDQQHHH